VLQFLGSAIASSQLGNLTRAIETDTDFRLAAAGPYDSATGAAEYAIWVRK
jgi:hypothetical protein